MADMLTSEEQNELVQTAIESIHREVNRLPLHRRSVTRDRDVIGKNLLEKCGAFVTLYEHGELRGCLGQITSSRPLIETVSEIAARTASSDPRFLPVEPEEVKDLEIEISVISPLKEISSTDEIEIGKHGLVVESDGRKGLLLPQVATKYGWDATTFLEETCAKAGLSPDQWKLPRTCIFTFTAEIVGKK
jgi:AmmeMemoRadiSam system protein A